MRSAIALIAILLLAGCDSTDLPVMDVEDMRLAILGGDGQVGPVQEASSSIRVASVGPQGVLPDTLVAMIEDASGGNANLPPNTVVNYVVPTDGCGAPWAGTALPNDSALVRELWTKPAGLLPSIGWQEVGADSVWGSLCTMEARTVVDNTFATDTVFQAVFTPGAPDPNGPLKNPTWSGSDFHKWTAPQDYVGDVYGNPHVWRLTVDCACAHMQGDDFGYDGKTILPDTAGVGTWSAVLFDGTVWATGPLEIQGPGSTGAYTVVVKGEGAT